MALNKTNLKTAILNLLDDMADRINNPAQAREDFATQLSDAIDTYVKTGTVSVTVNTTGTASAQSGSGTGTIS